MATDTEIIYDLDEIIDFKTSIPIGDYVARVRDVQLDMSKGDEPSPVLRVTFEIQEGEYAAEDLFKSYSLKFFTVSKGKNKGALGCNGLSDIRKEAAAVGEASKLPKRGSGSELRKAYAGIFGKKKLLVTKSLQKDYKGTTNEDGTDKYWPRIDIKGLAQKTTTSTTSASADPLAELGL